jgi:hypothetical protein
MPLTISGSIASRIARLDWVDPLERQLEGHWFAVTESLSAPRSASSLPTCARRVGWLAVKNVEAVRSTLSRSRESANYAV